MSSLVWSPTWHRPGESLWSALNKVAFSTRTSVGAALAFITGLNISAVRGLTLATDARVAVLVCEALQLAVSCAAQLFAGIYPIPLEVRQYLQLGLRWCPECLACGGYHSARFQDWRLEACPWHGCLLEDRCPRCRCAVDPLCDQPWACNYCREPLYRPGSTWLAAFKAAPDFLAKRTGPADSFFETTMGRGVVRVRRKYLVQDGAGRPFKTREADVLITQAACEELSALADTVFASHRECLAGHAHVSMLQCSLVRFTCPDAAAAVRLAAWHGIGTFSLETGWAASVRPPAGLVHGRLRWEMEQMPAWCRRLYVQACVRAWLVDAVGVFREAVASGGRAEWRPTGRLRPAWSFDDDTFTLNGVPSLTALKRLSAPGHERPLASVS